MTFELAIATMHKTQTDIVSMLKVMNVQCDCLVVNQCDEEGYYELQLNSQKLRMFFTKERGLSKSRNMVLKNTKADILAMTDDDLFYYDNFDKIILNCYEKTPKADVIIFNMDDCYKEFPLKSHKCGFFELSGYKSVQCTVRVRSIREKKLKFDECFGTGSAYFNSGEENIFLANCWRNRLIIRYCSSKILKRERNESSWYTGVHDETFIFTRGAIYCAMTKLWCFFYIIRFAAKYKKENKPFTILQAIKLMLAGRRRYLEIKKLGI